MPRPRKSFPTHADFKIRFPRVLQDHYAAHGTIKRILADQDLRILCSTLLWDCVNDVSKRLSGKKYQKMVKQELDTAVAGIDAQIYVYTQLDRKPALTEFLQLLKADLVAKQQVVANAPAPIDRGRNLDWSLVEYAQQTLAQRLGGPVSDAVLADLLCASFDVCSWKQVISEDGVRHGLARYQERRCEKLRPALWNILSRQFPTGDKFKVQ